MAAVTSCENDLLHMKDNVEIGRLTKFDSFRLNRDQVMGLETWFKIHTNEI